MNVCSNDKKKGEMEEEEEKNTELFPLVVLGKVKHIIEPLLVDLVKCSVSIVKLHFVHHRMGMRVKVK